MRTTAAAGPFAALLAVLAGALLGGVSFSTAYSETFHKFGLARESLYESKCPPEVVDISNMPKITARIRCHIQCIFKASCTFFSVKGTSCWLWSFELDLSYHTGDFGSVTTVAYKPKPSSPPPPQDIALGKPVTAESTFSGYDAAMLTWGTFCFPVMEDCFCTRQGELRNVQVDLQGEYFISKVALTSPITGDCTYFTEITIWAGVTGNIATDTMVGTTDSATPPEHTTYEFPANLNARYITIRRQNTSAAMCLCKIQALL